MSRLRRSAAAAERLLARVESRAVLSVAIVVSLLPVPAVDALSGVFLTLFGAELLLRVLALFRPAPAEGDAPGRGPFATGALLALDALALASFVPLGPPHAAPAWLRVFRLTRMLLLAGYWSPLLHDLRTVVTQRSRSRQVLLMGFAVALLAFGGAVLLHHLAPQNADFDGNNVVDTQDGAFGLRLWWAFRQIQDPGNMMQSPSDWAAVVVSVFLTVSGLLLVSFLIGLGTDVVREMVELSRTRPTGLSRHLVVVHTTTSTPRVLAELVRHYRKSFRRPQAALLGSEAERPDFLDAPALRHIQYRQGTEVDAETLRRVDATAARRVVVLSEARRPDADAHTTRALLAVRETNREAWLVAEVLDPRSVSAARAAGGERTVIVPSEKLLGLAVAAMVRRPGIEGLLRSLLSSAGHEIYTFLFDAPDFDCPGRPLRVRGPDDLERVVAGGADDGDGPRVLVVGALLPPEPGRRGHRVRLGAPSAVVTEGGAIAGLVAVAESFRVMKRFATAALDGAGPSGPPPAAGASGLAVSAPEAPDEVVVLGFRPAVVHLLESLMLAAPGVRVQLLVRTAAERDEALVMLREHSLHQKLGLWREHGPATRFEAQGDGTLSCHARAGAPACGRLRIDVADWHQDHVLLDRPHGGGSLADADHVLVAGGPHPDDDARTATVVLRIADLVGSARLAFAPHFRVTALVVDERLGQLLEARTAASSGAAGCFRALSTRETGAWFTFQSAVVPGFDAIWSELLGPWGQGLVWAAPAPGGDPAARWTFGELSRALRAEGRTLIGVVARGVDGAPELVIAPPAGRTFARGEVVGAWLVAEEGLAAEPRTTSAIFEPA